jgi:hypothetical protein
MERTQCRSFRLDFDRIRGTQESEPRHRTRREQMEIDFNAGYTARLFPEEDEA